MSTAGLLTTVIIIAVVIFAIVRQVLPRRVNRLTFIILPVIAAFEAYQHLPRPTIPANQGMECLVTVLVALAAGVVQAFSTRVYTSNSVLYTKGNIVTVIAWIALVASRLLISFVFQGPAVFHDYGSVQWILWAAVAVTFGTRSIVLYLLHPEINSAFAAQRARRRAR